MFGVYLELLAHVRQTRCPVLLQYLVYICFIFCWSVVLLSGVAVLLLEQAGGPFTGGALAVFWLIRQKRS